MGSQVKNGPHTGFDTGTLWYRSSQSGHITTSSGALAHMSADFTAFLKEIATSPGIEGVAVVSNGQCVLHSQDAFAELILPVSS